MNSFSRFLPAVLLVAGGVLRAAPLQDATVVTADEMEAHSTETETFSTFTGHVIVDSNNIHIVCDRLDTVSSRTGEKSEVIGNQAQFKHLQADGHVHIVQTDREAICGHAEVLEGQDRVVLTENPVIIDHGNGTVTAGDKITLLRAEHKIQIDHIHLIGPAMKDLNLDKSTLPSAAPPAKPAEATAAPAPAPDTPASPAPAPPPAPAAPSP